MASCFTRFGPGSCCQAPPPIKFQLSGPGAELSSNPSKRDWEVGIEEQQPSYLGVFVQLGPFICFHNRFVFLMALLLSGIGPSIKKKWCSIWTGKDGGAFAGPICSFLNIYIPVPKGANSVLYLSFMSTGWRGLIKNTFQKQPPRFTQNFHCLLLIHSCAPPTLLLLSLHYLKPNVDLVNFLFECKPIPWSYFSIVTLKTQGFPVTVPPF